MYKYIKRIIDIVGSLVLLVFLFPLFVIVAIMIRMDSKGPIFYIQERMGRNQKKIKVYKFRSMVDHAREIMHKTNAKQNTVITGVGKIIRKCRIDELPQLLNILKGEMSFIGPRPNIYENELGMIRQEPEYARRLLVTPGVTSIERLIHVWFERDRIIRYFIDHKNVKLNYKDRYKSDLYYVDNLSFGLDMIISYYTGMFFVDRVKRLILRKRSGK